MKYFTIAELCKSDTADRKGIDNRCKKEHVANLTALVDNVLDPLREAYGKPITINSGFRSPALNKAVGGSAPPVTTCRVGPRISQEEVRQRTRSYSILCSPLDYHLTNSLTRRTSLGYM